MALFDRFAPPPVPPSSAPRTRLHFIDSLQSPRAVVGRTGTAADAADHNPGRFDHSAGIDRLLHGHVIDFLQFHWPWLDPLFRGGYFPSFNVADAAITLGAVCLVLDELLRVRRGR